MFDPVLVLPSLPFRTYETVVESYVPVCTYLSMHARPCRASNRIYECMLKSWEGEDYSPLLASIVHRFLLHIKLWKPLRIEHRTFLANQSYDAFSLPLPASPPTCYLTIGSDVAASDSTSLMYLLCTYNERTNEMNPFNECREVFGVSIYHDGIDMSVNCHPGRVPTTHDPIPHDNFWYRWYRYEYGLTTKMSMNWHTVLPHLATFKSSHIHPGVCAIDPKLARWKIAIVSAHSSCPAIQIHTWPSSILCASRSSLSRKGGDSPGAKYMEIIQSSCMAALWISRLSHLISSSRTIYTALSSRYLNTRLDTRY